MVTPECPPITGTLVRETFKPFNSETNVSERNTSKVVTPNNLRLS